MTRSPSVPPFHELDRATWGKLRTGAAPRLDGSQLLSLAARGESLSTAEVSEVYAPLAELIGLHVAAARSLHSSTTRYLGQDGLPVPFVIGIAGSVAVGKSTTARVLRELLASSESKPKVDLVTTDGFLLPNAELTRRGILHRKGFPESYDRRSLLRFVSRVKAGQDEVSAPTYSHVTYDIVADERITVRRPDVLILEGLNVLAPPHALADGRVGLAVSDFFDFAVYLDATPADLRRWYVARFLALRRTAFADSASYFHRYATLSDDEATATAQRIWAEINEPNLVENIAPTRGRATVVLTKSADHSVSRILVRRL